MGKVSFFFPSFSVSLLSLSPQKCISPFCLWKKQFYTVFDSIPKPQGLLKCPPLKSHTTFNNNEDVNSDFLSIYIFDQLSFSKLSLVLYFMHIALPEAPTMAQTHSDTSSRKWSFLCPTQILGLRTMDVIHPSEKVFLILLLLGPQAEFSAPALPGEDCIPFLFLLSIVTFPSTCFPATLITCVSSTAHNPSTESVLLLQLEDTWCR